MRTEVKVGIITALVVIAVVTFIALPPGDSEGETDIVPYDPVLPPTGESSADVRAPTGDRTGVATPERRRTEPSARRESLRSQPPAPTDAERQPARPPAGPPEVLTPEAADEQIGPGAGTAPGRDRVGERIDEEYGLADAEPSTTQTPPKPADADEPPDTERAAPPAEPEDARPPTPGVPVPKRPDEARDGDPPLPGFKRTAGTQRHVIRPGDTLWALAEYYYGDGRLHNRILQANPGLNENSLRIGREIVIPPEEAFTEGPTGTRPSPTTEPGVRRHTYVVERGDTLIKIARNVLGDDSRWREIYELNKDRIANPNVVPIGLELKLPEE